MLISSRLISNALGISTDNSNPWPLGEGRQHRRCEANRCRSTGGPRMQWLLFSDLKNLAIWTALWTDIRDHVKQLRTVTAMSAKQ